MTQLSCCRLVLDRWRSHSGPGLLSSLDRQFCFSRCFSALAFRTRRPPSASLGKLGGRIVQLFLSECLHCWRPWRTLFSHGKNFQPYLVSGVRFPLTCFCLLTTAFLTESVIILAWLVGLVDPHTGPVEPFLTLAVTANHSVLVVHWTRVVPVTTNWANIGIFFI